MKFSDQLPDSFSFTVKNAQLATLITLAVNDLRDARHLVTRSWGPSGESYLFFDLKDQHGGRSVPVIE